MDALLVDGVNLIVTPFTSLCIDNLFPPSGEDGMGPMAVHTNRGIRSPLYEHTVMDTFQGSRIFVKMTSPATI